VKSDEVPRYYGGKRFGPTAEHNYSMKKLNDLRNDFIHFFPKSWSVEVTGLPAICKNCVEVAYFLGWESGTIIWHSAELSERGRNAASLFRSVS